MALELSRIDRRAHSIPGEVDIALLPPHSEGPTADTEWISGNYADGATTFLLAGPEADPTGAVVVPASAVLWRRLVSGDEVDAEQVERITVLGGGSLRPLSTTGAVVVVHGADAGRERPATSLPVIWFGEVQPIGMTDADVYVTTVVQN